MRVMKRTLALLLAAASLLTLLIPGAMAADEDRGPGTVFSGITCAFPDVKDPVQQEAVEILRRFGYVGGSSDGNFYPNNKIDRAQYFTMIINMLGLQSQVAAYSTKTIFTDTTNHWAKGYINLAANTKLPPETGSVLTSGTGSGGFSPDRAITYKEAATVALKLVGYYEEADGNWPYGAIATAASIGLNQNLESLQADSEITRGQMAVLLYNSLWAVPKGGTESKLDGITAKQENVILYSVNAKMPDGRPAVQLLDPSKIDGGMDAAISTVPVDAYVPDASLVGALGTAYLGSDEHWNGQLLTFQVTNSKASVSITVASADARGINAVDGSRYPVTTDAKVLRNWTASEDVYGEVYKGLNRPGQRVSLYYDEKGNVTYLNVGDVGGTSGLTAVAAVNGYSAFDSITGGRRDCTVVKNGTRVPMSDLKAFDVGTYDGTTNTLYVSDLRIETNYQGGYPNDEVPTKVTVLNHEFTVLDCALDSIAKFKAGDMVTVLFSPDGRVAGFGNPSPNSRTEPNTPEVHSNNFLGWLDVVAGFTPAPGGDESDMASARSDETVTVHLLYSIPGYGGAPDVDRLSFALASGEPEDFSTALVQINRVKGTVSRGTVTDLAMSLNNLYSSRNGELNREKNTLGDAQLADNVQAFEKVWTPNNFSEYGYGPLVKVEMDDVPMSVVPSSKVIYRHLNSAGQVDAIVLDGVTGDAYTYGMIEYSEVATDKGFDGEDIMNASIEVSNRTSTMTVIGRHDFTAKWGDAKDPIIFGGVAKSLETIGAANMPCLGGSMDLNIISNMTQSCFNPEKGTFSGGSIQEIKVADNVQIYDGNRGSWVTENYSLRDIMNRYSTFTVLYDRTPEQGGKVRIIIAEG